MSARAWGRDMLLLSVLCLPVYFFAVTTQDSSHVLYLDNAWYLNRARLMWQGVFEEFFVYTIAYPLLVGAVDLLVREVVVAAMLVNIALMWAVTAGVYTLGGALYGRAVGALAALAMMTNVSFYLSGRRMWADILFMAVVVWCVVASRWVVARPSAARGALFGALLTVALYTRFEGAVYAGVLLLLVGGEVYYASRDWRRALRVALAGAAVFGVGAALYFYVMFQTTEPGTGGYALVHLLKTSPMRWDLLARRWTEALTAMLGHWPLWAWLLVSGAVLWDKRRRLGADLLCAGLIGLNVGYVFVLTPWPFPRYIEHFLPFFALLLMATLWRLAGRLKSHILPLAVAAISVPGLLVLLQYAPPFDYQDSEIAQTGREIDAWLAEKGQSDTEIFTFCSHITPFSRANFHFVTRLSTRPPDSLDWPNAPERLLPYIHEHNNLFMLCGEVGGAYLKDWQIYLEALESGEELPYPERLEEIGRVGDYVFYRVVRGGT